MTRADTESKVECLVKIGVFKKVNRSEWAAPAFAVPNTDGSARFISDFRELNKRMLRKPHPIPNIEDMLLNPEGVSMGNQPGSEHGDLPCCSSLNPSSKEVCAVELPFGKCEHQAISMGLCNSIDIFQEKMSELMDGPAFV